MNSTKSIKPFLKHLRKKKNISQQEIADKLFVSRSTYASWEKDEGKITLEMILKICCLFEISLSDIYDFSDNVKKEKSTHQEFLKKDLLLIENKLSLILSKI